MARLQIGTDMLLIITSTGDGLFRFINIDDLEPTKPGFLVYFLQFLAAAHISRVNCNKWLEVDQDNLHMTRFLSYHPSL